ncbi:hypothetical protein AX774_g2402 [Zancudomyces culisetae]|uniref:Uncharacterized protein n=1 Tax=Zancudomyces culisetae TaxID=1213189 RepID=A0A1R1PT30_ZANCU|nr:hypothetical protein AX774_g2402 [Zancudomyces culisetae]|eukprot:OMH84079.1 hypothetical protein AX774_g2402 [Zancudomyces culisetae]
MLPVITPIIVYNTPVTRTGAMLMIAIYFTVAGKPQFLSIPEAPATKIIVPKNIQRKPISMKLVVSIDQGFVIIFAGFIIKLFKTAPSLYSLKLVATSESVMYITPIMYPELWISDICLVNTFAISSFFFVGCLPLVSLLYYLLLLLLSFSFCTTW